MWVMAGLAKAGMAAAGVGVGAKQNGEGAERVRERMNLEVLAQIRSLFLFHSLLVPFLSLDFCQLKAKVCRDPL